MLDASSSGVFQTNSVEERWDLIERIQKNTEDWEIDKGIELTINYEHDYIESYVKTDYFNTFCSNIGLDSHLMIDFRKDFASHIDSSKKKKDHHHKPFKELPIDIHVADPIFPAGIYEEQRISSTTASDFSRDASIPLQAHTRDPTVEETRKGRRLEKPISIRSKYEFIMNYCVFNMCTLLIYIEERTGSQPLSPRKVGLKSLARGRRGGTPHGP